MSLFSVVHQQQLIPGRTFSHVLHALPIDSFPPLFVKYWQGYSLSQLKMGSKTVFHFSVYSLFPEKNQQSYRTISVVYTEGVDSEYQHFGLGIYH